MRQWSGPALVQVMAYCQLDKRQWNWNQNTKLFIHDNAFENVICEMATIIKFVKEEMS